jgi:hypothetical protein
MSKKKQHHSSHTQPQIHTKAKSDYKEKDAHEMKKFFAILAVVTLLLVVLIYFFLVK